MSDIGNLGRRAEKDLIEIIERSVERYGPIQADRMEAAILRRCRAIADGMELGHARPTLKTKRTIRFWNVPPFVVIYDARTRLIIRIVDGRRDLSRVLGGL